MSCSNVYQSAQNYPLYLFKCKCKCIDVIIHYIGINVQTSDSNDWICSLNSNNFDFSANIKYIDTTRRKISHQIDGLLYDCGISIANIQHSCTKTSNSHWFLIWRCGYSLRIITLPCVPLELKCITTIHTVCLDVCSLFNDVNALVAKITHIPFLAI